MTTPAVLESVRRPVPLSRRLAALAAVALARVLATRSPEHIRTVLTWVRAGAPPATVEQAQTARDGVVAVSTRCSGEYCLQRSIAITLLCRMTRSWPTWCVGVRTDPFGAHAWVEAAGRPVGEPFSSGYYRSLMTVPPAPLATRPASTPGRVSTSGPKSTPTTAGPTSGDRLS